jgi:hypothetical protein
MAVEVFRRHINGVHLVGGRTHVNHDPRSRNFPARTEGPVTSVRWHRHGVSLDQGQLGSCTGNAIAGLCNHSPNHLDHPQLTETDAVDIYCLGTELDGYDGTYPPTDTGCDGLSVSKAARQLGYLISWTTAFGVDHALAALMSGPLTIGVNWYEDMFNPDATGLVHPTGSLAGGHQFVMDGWDAVHGLFRFNNSWSNAWGKNGRFFMTYADVDTLLGQDGDAIQIQR